ncbi:glycoside hydrolase family 43 protein [Ferruginibacter sp. HRS2-29]|uniref:glycoside hydrolase family 43 protein n=1 Tax=Ferruginibacter sp. HRS2-29 TaxID=2487334 RepID=UPI0020CF9C8B|nr:glycoside hydrolase family 43 protein [Ferruginibacter sp. HRS2-29]MCP9753473.1 glycoside hydrolase family 43 protein [Ferruginibacter sp. HRS2-29]
MNISAKLTTSILFCLLLSAIKPFAQTTTLVNPILMGFYPDPSIVQVEKDYYLVNSTFSYFPGIPVFHSKDLKNWKQIGNVIDRTSQLDFMGERMTRGLFAPAISYYNGTYYVTCTDIDHEGNFVVTAKEPAGPWSDPVRIPQVRGIDPSLFFDDNGKAYIVYNSDAPDNKPLYSGHRTIRSYEFDPVSLKVTGEEKQLVNGGVDISKQPVWIEGPHIMKRNSWYYLYAAEGGTSVNHSEVVFRSRSVMGPYIPYEKNPILTQRDLPEDRKNPITSTGHAQFVDGPDGKTYAIFLAVRPYEGDYYNTGRETFIAPVEWKDEWPVINPNSKEVQYSYPVNIKEVKQKSTLPQSGNFSYKLTFKKELDPSLIFMRKPDSTAFSLSKKAGLTLKLKPETVMDMGSPSFVGKRQQHLYNSIETKITFKPTAENEKAGLAVFQSESHFYFMARSVSNGKEVMQLFKGKPKQKEMERITEIPLATTSSKLYLKINAEGSTYSFYYSPNGKDWILLKDKVDAKFVSTKTAGGFVGCIYGMYATSSGLPSSNIASFKFLTYTGNDPVYR